MLLSLFCLLMSFVGFAQTPGDVKIKMAGPEPPEIAEECVTRCGTGTVILTASGGMQGTEYHWWGPGGYIGSTSGSLTVGILANTTATYSAGFYGPGNTYNGIRDYVQVISDPIRVTVTPNFTSLCMNAPISYTINITNVDCNTTHSISISDQAASAFVRTGTSPFPPGAVSLAPGNSLSYTVSGSYNASGTFTYKPLVTDITLNNCLESPSVTTTVTAGNFNIEQGNDVCAATSIVVQPLPSAPSNSFVILDSDNITVPGSNCTFTSTDPHCILQVPTLPGIYTVEYTSVNGTCNTTTTKPLYVFGKDRRPFFDGQDDRITAPNHANYNRGSGAFTIEAWVNVPGGYPEEGTIVSIGEWQSDGIIFATTPGGTGLFLGAAGGRAYSNTLVSSIYDDECHHVAVAFDGSGKASFFVDGNPIGNSPISSDLTSTSELWIGNSSTGEIKPWHGTIDEVRFWKVGRSQGQITTAKTMRIPDNLNDLIGYWPLNELNLQEHLDYSQSNNNAVLGIDNNTQQEDPGIIEERGCLNYCGESEYRIGKPQASSSANKTKQLTFEVKLAPNPSNTESSLEVIGNTSDSYQVRIITPAGQEILQHEIAGSELLNIGRNLKPGIYYIQVFSKNSSQVLKFIKQ